MSRYLSLSVLSFILFFNGCSITSFLFDVHNPRPVVVIDYPPNRIAYGGTFDKESKEQVIDILQELEKRPYRAYKHPFPLGATLDTIQVESKSTSFNGSTSLETKTK